MTKSKTAYGRICLITALRPDRALQSTPAYLRLNAKKFSEKPAFREKEFGVWQTWTWSQVEKDVTELALGLLHLGVAEGDFVAIIGRNRPALYW